MLQSLDSREVAERMGTAAENLKRILEDLRPFTDRPKKVEEVSTAGTWRSCEDSFPQLDTLD